MSSTGIRLQKYIADCGITSRRKAEALILQDRVKINGVISNVLGTKVNPGSDVIEVDGEVADLSKTTKVYVVLNKPRSYMTTLNDPEGRRTVMDLVKDVPERIYPVGRLDYLSEGLLVLTNDGELANQIIHPSSNVIKVYEVKVFGSINASLLKKLRQGAYLEDIGKVKPDSVRVIKQLPTKTWLEFRLNEGKNREIRRLCDHLGITIDKLKRLSIGGLSVEGIAPGRYRVVTKRDLLNTVMAPGAEPFSRKKSVSLHNSKIPMGTLANDESFSKFNKGSYYESLVAIEKSKKEKKERESQESLKKRDDAHFKRVANKKARLEKKEEGRKKSIHAAIVK